MAFEMVGVQLDEAGDEVVALDIFAGCRVSVRKCRRSSVADEKLARDDLVFEDDAGVGENGFFDHVRQVFQLSAAGKREPVNEL